MIAIYFCQSLSPARLPLKVRIAQWFPKWGPWVSGNWERVRYVIQISRTEARLYKGTAEVHGKMELREVYFGTHIFWKHIFFAWIVWRFHIYTWNSMLLCSKMNLPFHFISHELETPLTESEVQQAALTNFPSNSQAWRTWRLTKLGSYEQWMRDGAVKVRCVCMGVWVCVCV